LLLAIKFESNVSQDVSNNEVLIVERRKRDKKKNVTGRKTWQEDKAKREKEDRKKTSLKYDFFGAFSEVFHSIFYLYQNKEKTFA